MAMYLKQELAQEIVDRTMAILHYNINVMDQEGRIIGSGDMSRILSKHEVASKVIERKETFEIQEDNIDQWSGVKAGINLPIFFQEEVVGVVGITGNPNETRGYGQLVKMTAEMIIEQSFLQKQLQLDKRITDEVILQLINGKNLDEDLIYEKAKALRLDLTIPRVIIIIKSTSNQVSTTQKLEQMLAKMIDDQDITVTTYTGEIVILKRISVNQEQWEVDRTINTIRIWVSQLSKVSASVKIAIGSYYATYKQLYKSYKEAKETLMVGTILTPEKNLYMYEEYSLYVLINELTKFLENNPFFQLLNKLKEQDELGELQKTLQVYIKEDGKVNNTSNQLHIHRNSLQYRLEKIKDITGKDPRNYKDLLELYLCIVIDKLTHEERRLFI